MPVSYRLQQITGGLAYLYYGLQRLDDLSGHNVVMTRQKRTYQRDQRVNG